MPRWEDYLALACTEIREYGRNAIQVVRRLHAMLETLHETVLAQHRRAVEEELDRLRRSVEADFGDSVDLDRAGAADSQGIGGPAASRAI